MFDFAAFLEANAWHKLMSVPGAVSRLRGVILQLAVRSQLVPQNPDNEPAKVLCERIAAR